jgi:hypothetical protein
MDDRHEIPIGEKQVLSHEPIPGYRPAFYITVAAGIVWLLLSFTGVV